MWNALVKPISDVVNNIVDKIAPDAEMAEKLKAAFAKELLEYDSKVLEKQANIIVAEATGESWLQRNWRPLVMVNFAVLINVHWLGYTPENLSETQILGLLEIVRLGLSGYIVGRSAEKVMKEYKK